MKYSAIIFDLFGTLVDSPSISEREINLKAIASILGVSYSDFEREWRKTSTGRDMGIFPNFRSALEFVGEILSAKPDIRQQERAENIRMAYYRDLLVVRNETIEVLKRLKKSGHKIGLISDCSSEVPALWDTIPLSPLVDVAVFSCQMRIKKPDARIYLETAERLGAKPGQCLYVGDGGSRELTGATQAGMDAILMSAHIDDPGAYVLDREDWTGRSVPSLDGISGMAE